MKPEITSDGIFAGRTEPPPLIRILGALFYMPKRESIRDDGQPYGYTTSKIKKLVGTNQPTVKKNIEILRSAGMIEDCGERYALTSQAVISLRQLTTRAPAEGGGLEKESVPEKKTINDSESALEEVLFAPHEIEDFKTSGVETIYVVKVPASALLAGDYSVVLGAPAVPLSVPLYLYAGMYIQTSSGSEENLHTWLKSGGPGMSFYELKQHNIFGGYRTEIDAHARKLLEEFTKMLADKLGKRYPVSLYFVNEIPMRCGLGSSGALSAALALLLNICADEEIVKETNGWRRDPDKLVKSEKFSAVFRDAYNLEKIIHERSSGVGPFASLVGSTDGTPFLYRRNKPSSDEDISVESYERLEKENARRWRKEFGIALIYTRIRRDRTGDLLTFGRIQDRLAGTDLEWKERMEVVTQKLWENIKSSDWNDVVAAMSLYSQFETGYLKIMLPADFKRFDDPQLNVRKLCGFFHGLGLGAKYTGSGNGGDLIVGGTPARLKQGYIKNYFPVHFASDMISKDECAVLPQVSIIDTYERTKKHAK